MADITTANFLWEASRILPCTVPSVIRANLLSRNSYIREKHSSTSVASRYTKITICKYCCNPLFQERCHLKIIPSGQLSKKMLKIKTRFNNNPYSVSKYDRNLLKKYGENMNKLVILCPLCKKKNKIKMQKQSKAKRKWQPEVQGSAKKRRRSQDPFAGLNISNISPGSLTPGNHMSARKKRKMLNALAREASWGQGASSEGKYTPTNTPSSGASKHDRVQSTPFRTAATREFTAKPKKLQHLEDQAEYKENLLTFSDMMPR